MEYQEQLVFDVWPSSLGRLVDSGGETRWKSCLMTVAVLSSLGFSVVQPLVTNDRPGSDLDEWKRQDDMGLTVYLTPTKGGGVRVKHQYLHSSISTSFDMTDEYARALFTSRYDNSRLFNDFPEE